MRKAHKLQHAFLTAKPKTVLKTRFSWHWSACVAFSDQQNLREVPSINVVVTTTITTQQNKTNQIVIKSRNKCYTYINHQ